MSETNVNSGYWDREWWRDEYDKEQHGRASPFKQQ